MKPTTQKEISTIGNSAKTNFWLDFYRLQEDFLSGERIYKIKAIKNLCWLGETLKRVYKIAERHNLERKFLKDLLLKLSKKVCALKKTI